MGVVYGQWAGPYPGPTLTERRSAKTRRAAGPNAGDRKNGWGGGVVCQTVDGSPPPPPGHHWHRWLSPKKRGFGAAQPNAGDKENGEGGTNVVRRSWGGVWWAVGGAVFWVPFHG